MYDRENEQWAERSPPLEGLGEVQQQMSSDTKPKDMKQETKNPEPLAGNGGKLIIFSAPSGSGKTTIVRYLLEQPELNLAFSVSATSRPRRVK